VTLDLDHEETMKDNSDVLLIEHLDTSLCSYTRSYFRKIYKRGTEILSEEKACTRASRFRLFHFIETVSD
jgi:hypothetical protein